MSRSDAELLLPVPSPPRRRPRQAFDFDAAYAHYPRKQGKKRGMQMLPQIIRDQEDYRLLLECCVAMGEAWKGHAICFCPHWSTFVRDARWRDEHWPMPLGDND